MHVCSKFTRSLVPYACSFRVLIESTRFRGVAPTTLRSRKAEPGIDGNGCGSGCHASGSCRQPGMRQHDGGRSRAVLGCKWLERCVRAVARALDWNGTQTFTIGPLQAVLGMLWGRKVAARALRGCYYVAGAGLGVSEALCNTARQQCSAQALTAAARCDRPNTQWPLLAPRSGVGAARHPQRPLFAACTQSKAAACLNDCSITPMRSSTSQVHGESCLDATWWNKQLPGRRQRVSRRHTGTSAGTAFGCSGLSNAEP
jgi:hypothetical protein